jgi:hypothetical protein
VKKATVGQGLQTMPFGSNARSNSREESDNDQWSIDPDGKVRPIGAPKTIEPDNAKPHKTHHVIKGHFMNPEIENEKG